MSRKRKSRRVQYLPELVLVKIMNNDFLRTLVHAVYSAKLPVSAGEIAKEVSRLLRSNYSPSYVSVYLKRLEKWGAVRAYRDPTNGHLLWWRSDKRVAQLIEQELSKHELRKVIELAENLQTT